MELKDQFLPTNTTWVAREFLKRLRHTRLMREQKVHDLPTAMAAADYLVEYKMGGAISTM
ncbi:hypothetical protein CK203_103372 [Vitis vinifera]|uniref:Uncharacterized protein n=1 Tax=Vitis vinifera TaxID=29760 RepID=A0A438EJ77_VITVI|nr:hypothetical protein CK203_103372 [Vitis vinifera]